jgi:hypothetical protein
LDAIARPRGRTFSRFSWILGRSEKRYPEIAVLPGSCTTTPVFMTGGAGVENTPSIIALAGWAADLRSASEFSLNFRRRS